MPPKTVAGELWQESMFPLNLVGFLEIAGGCWTRWIFCLIQLAFITW